jgi:tetratricopeptide (TPR) repeat protein
MAEYVEKKPGWAESPLYEQGVAHFEAEQWEQAISTFSQLATEFPHDPELQQILAGLRLKASLPLEETLRGRMWMRRLGRAALLVLGVVALIAVLAGVSYFIYTNWVLPARTYRDQATHLRELHELARGYSAAGEYERAADLYREILREEPDDATAAAGLERAEELQELTTAYDRALELTQEERWDEALEAWRTIRATDPNFRDVDRWIAFAEQQQALYSLFTEAEMRYWIQDWSGTIDLLEQVRGQNANYRREWVESLLVSSLVNLAEQMLSDASDPAAVYSQVMELFDRAIQIRPQDESVLTQRAVAEAYSEAFARFQEGGCAGALQEIQSLYDVELRGASSQCFAILYQANIHCGDERVQAGDFQGAQACYEAAIDLPLDDVSEASDKYAALVPMLTPTATPSPRPTRPPATPTPRSPTPTSTSRAPTPTPVPLYDFRYVQGSMLVFPNCGTVHLKGKIIGMGGEPVSGRTVRLRWGGGWVAYKVSGTGESPGEWGFAPLASEHYHSPFMFQIDIVESEANPVPQSDTLEIMFTGCESMGQIENITFQYAR